MPIRNYAEASFFDGFHFSHIADWLEHLRLKRIELHCIAQRNAARRSH